MSLELRSRDRFVSELVGFSSADRLWVHAFLSPTRRADSSGRRPSLLPFAPSPSLSQVLDFDFYLSPIFLHPPIHVFLLSTRTSRFCMYMHHICFFKSTSISLQLLLPAWLPLFLLPSLSLHLVFSLRILDVGFTILIFFQSKKSTVLRTVLLYLLVFFVCATDYF